MTGLDERIVRALRENADRPVDAERLLTAAVNGGRARRRRRRAVLGAALGVAVALGAGGVVLRTPSAAPPTPAVTPSPAVVTPPRATGVPGAAARPELVGTDAGVLHYGVDPAVAEVVAWRSATGVESMRLDLGGGRQAMVVVAADAFVAETGDPAQLRDVGVGRLSTGTADDDRAPSGRPDYASLYRGLAHRLDQVTNGWVLRWQPVPGLYARVATTGDTAAEARRAATALRFDEARRCVAPIRLTALPPGARITECDVSARTLAWPRVQTSSGRSTPTPMPVVPADETSVTLRIALSGDATLPVRLDHSPTMGEERNTANRTIGGRPVFDMGDFWHVLGIPHTLLSMGWENRWERSPTLAEVTTVIGGLQVADDLGEAATWE
ncbi:hypothetical protein ACFOOK_08620 [Micromonospora krabiensis]|uniref:Uncharacterized protein n=1 Tax=Micromonospora krabiensis TaxID=307121 RepID=A0A1C3NBK5_9ACTN|nr:hypothetical protein [Micromonospora krabiensis]SBV29938.1 hypothetical protein GA0070620_5525 [Micromonospora krabiensis]